MTKIIPNLNKFLGKKSIITDVGSTKQNVLNLKNKKLNKSLNWILSHPISGSEVSGPEYGSQRAYLLINGVLLLKIKILENKKK